LTEWLADIIESAGVDWDIQVGNAGPEEGVERVAKRERRRLSFGPAVRNEWENPSAAFHWWRSRIESLGAFCFVMKLPPRDIRGASVWKHPVVPAILVNHEDMESHTGRIFTLLHEYAHLLVKEAGVACDLFPSRHADGVEFFANRFAAEMLVTRSELRQRLRELDMDEVLREWSERSIDELRKGLFVSRDVIEIRLEEMGLAPKGFYQKRREAREKKQPFVPFRFGTGRRPSDFELKLRELGTSFGRIVSHPAVEAHLPALDLSYILEMKVQKARRFISWLRDTSLPGISL
jgi:Zn-dependent peptidase ImmA (M78 family)